MARKSFTTTINNEIQEKFKRKCKEKNEKMNDVLEAFMKGYIDDKYTLEVSYSLQVKK